MKYGFHTCAMKPKIEAAYTGKERREAHLQTPSKTVNLSANKGLVLGPRATANE